MAENIVSVALVEDLLIESTPELESGADSDVMALSALLQPALDLVVEAYQQVSRHAGAEVAFRRFVERLAQAGD
ncbi:hypothetical protein [Achromobacter aloeverae]|uniref:hypothetical protein n=1 Tax=Achromobacter aloeverae TaxID=1750518 RepID=UPI00100F5917|nr:hypothetical protein [Achromobacter aloeverae]